MSQAQLLSAVGLIRTSRRRGFCPACRLFQKGDGPQEVSPSAVMALAFLIVAGLAWTVTIARMSSMEDMPMGLGPLAPFVVAWTVLDWLGLVHGTWMTTPMGTDINVTEVMTDLISAVVFTVVLVLIFRILINALLKRMPLP